MIMSLFRLRSLVRPITAARNTCRSISRSTPTFKRLPSVKDAKDPLKIVQHELLDGRIDKILPCPRECDVLVIGGSVVGSSTAYFLKENQNKLNVVVIEPDQSYRTASAVLSAGGMRQQFSCRENIEMSQFGFEFLRRANHLLAVDGESPPDVQFSHSGYLIMVGKEDADDLQKNHELQKTCGAVNYLLSADMLKKKFPWMNVEGVELACLGKHGEGWLDPSALLSALKGKARSLGATYVSGKVVGFEHKDVVLSPGVKRKCLDMALVELPNGDVQPIKAPMFVNAAGPMASEVAYMAGIGNEEIHFDCTVPLPVEPRKRFVYYFHSPDGPGLDCPLAVDGTQDYFYWRREGLGNRYICGQCPPPDQEHDHSNLDVDYDFFDNELWSKLAHRVPAFENLKVQSAWAGYYDYNYIDHNLIIGNHPYFNNFLFANGSSGHGLQHSPAIGRAISELIIYDKFHTVDLDNFTFNRFLEPSESQAEKNVY